jgi:hypothetical protein
MSDITRLENLIKTKVIVENEIINIKINIADLQISLHNREDYFERLNNMIRKEMEATNE